MCLFVIADIQSSYKNMLETMESHNFKLYKEMVRPTPNKHTDLRKQPEETLLFAFSNVIN